MRLRTTQGRPLREQAHSHNGSKPAANPAYTTKPVGASLLAMATVQSMQMEAMPASSLSIWIEFQRSKGFRLSDAPNRSLTLLSNCYIGEAFSER